MKLHTRFVFTPTGPAHVGHAYMARLNREMARASGGTFVYRFEDVLAYQSGAQFSSDRLVVCRENLLDMQAVGLVPSPPAELREAGLSPSAGIYYQSGNSTTSHYWRLFGLAKVFGHWPPLDVEGSVSNKDAVYLQSTPGRWHPSVMHPYVVLDRVVWDIATGRTHIVRGEELRAEAALYAAFARMVCRDWQPLPEQYYVPLLHFEDKGELVCPSSSNAAHEPYWLKTVQAAGRNGEELFEFLDRYCWQAPGAAGKCLPVGPPVGKAWAGIAVLADLREQIVIPRKDWDKFLKGGR